MPDEERKGLTIRGKAFRANIAKQDVHAVIPSTAHSKIVGGRCTHMVCVMDSGCSFPITSSAVAEALGAEENHLLRSWKLVTHQIGSWKSSERSRCSSTIEY